MNPIRMLGSHAYPGAVAIIDGEAREGPVHVEFADGIVTEAHLKPLDGERIRLNVAAYNTAKGSAIAAKVWILEPDVGQCWKVRRRGERI